MAGYEVCSLVCLQDFRRILPIIAYTGRDAEKFWNGDKTACFDRYLLKGIDQKQVIAAINFVLNSK